MLLDASVARSTDSDAFLLVRRFALGLALLVTGVGLLVSLTPLYTLIVDRLMNIPPDVATEARPTLIVLSFWPLPIAWRRAQQGLLIRVGRTTVISVATGVRLVSLAVTLFVGLYLFPSQGAVVAGVAMVLSVTVESVVITWATRLVLEDGYYGEVGALDSKGTLTMRRLWRFYQPLAVTTILRQTTRPLLNAGVAAASMPRPSLAAWPVAWGLTILIAGPAWSLQQLTTALSTDHAAYRRVARFSLTLSVLFSLLLAVIVFSPLYGVVMGGVYNLSPALQQLARPAMKVMTIYPLLLGAQSVLRGALIRGGRTSTVRAAMTASVLTLAATLVLGVTILSPTGVMLAAAATLAGGVAELVYLLRKARP
jgi:Na+-driven multidrug efflux pump